MSVHQLTLATVKIINPMTSPITQIAADLIEVFGDANGMAQHCQRGQRTELISEKELDEFRKRISACEHLTLIN